MMSFKFSAINFLYEHRLNRLFFSSTPQTNGTEQNIARRTWNVICIWNLRAVKSHEQVSNDLPLKTGRMSFRREGASVDVTAASNEGALLERIAGIWGWPAPLANKLEHIAAFLAVGDLRGHEELVPVVLVGNFALSFELETVPEHGVARNDTGQGGDARGSHKRSFVGSSFVFRQNLLERVVHWDG